MIFSISLFIYFFFSSFLERFFVFIFFHKNWGRWIFDRLMGCVGYFIFFLFLPQSGRIPLNQFFFARDEIFLK